MKDKDHTLYSPVHRAPATLEEMVARFVRGDVVLACDRHKAAIRAFAQSLTSDQECEDDVLLEVDASLQCEDCTLIAEALLGHFPSEDEDSERIVTACREALYADRVDTSALASDTEKRPQIFSISRGKTIWTAGPIYLPQGPFCPTPVRRAAEEPLNPVKIKFGEERSVSLSDRNLPEPVLQGVQFPLVVTTPCRAQLEYAKGKDWHVPLPLAPQKTRIILHRNSRLYDVDHRTGFSDYELAIRLDRCVIAVADKTSSYASRLILAARQAGIREVFISERELRSKNFKRKERVLYLVKSHYPKMIDLLAEERIDGFSTVEPFPTLAKFRLGDRWAEANLHDSCTSQSSGFCCVVMIPAGVVAHADVYDALLDALIRSICSLLTPGGPEALTDRFEKILRGFPHIERHFDLRAVATEAAVNTLSHFTAHLQDHPKQSRWYAQRLVPEMGIEAIRAEALALLPHLTLEEQRKVSRNIERIVDPRSNHLYQFARAREIFAEVIMESPEAFDNGLQSLEDRLKRLGGVS